MSELEDIKIFHPIYRCLLRLNQLAIRFLFLAALRSCFSLTITLHEHVIFQDDHAF